VKAAPTTTEHRREKKHNKKPRMHLTVFICLFPFDSDCHRVIPAKARMPKFRALDRSLNNQSRLLFSWAGRILGLESLSQMWLQANARTGSLADMQTTRKMQATV
jgi:hypothetical protein